MFNRFIMSSDSCVSVHCSYSISIYIFKISADCCRLSWTSQSRTSKSYYYQIDSYLVLDSHVIFEYDTVIWQTYCISLCPVIVVLVYIVPIVYPYIYLKFQPIVALIRPLPGSLKRKVFNWIHWGLGTIGHILAGKGLQSCFNVSS
jgi:hypothetical protein